MPSPRRPPRRAAPGAAGRRRATTRSAAPSGAACDPRARGRPRPPARPTARVAAPPRCAPPPRGWRRRSGRRALPTAGSGAPSRRCPRRPAGASRPPPPARPDRGGRRRRWTRRGSPLRPAAARQPPCSRPRPRWFNSARWRTWRRWSRRCGRRPACSASAISSSSSACSADIDGDDAALVEHRGEYLVVCGEAISPPFLAEDPFGAGSAAVVTNVSDVRAMGARPLALVDMLVSPDREHAERVLDGIAWAAERLGVPVVGGHLTIGHAASLSASCTGVARKPLRASAAEPGDALLAAFALDGRYMSATRPFFTALHDRSPEALRQDGEALVEVAEAGLCHAARDVSMPGHRRLAAADGRGRRLWRGARPRAAPPPGRRRARPLAADVPQLRVPAGRTSRARARGVRGLRAPRPDVRGVRPLRRLARAQSGRRGDAAPVWDLSRTPLTGLAPGTAGSPSAGA